MIEDQITDRIPYRLCDCGANGEGCDFPDRRTAESGYLASLIFFAHELHDDFCINDLVHFREAGFAMVMASLEVPDRSTEENMALFLSRVRDLAPEGEWNWISRCFHMEDSTDYYRDAIAHAVRKFGGLASEL